MSKITHEKIFLQALKQLCKISPMFVIKQDKDKVAVRKYSSGTGFNETIYDISFSIQAPKSKYFDFDPTKSQDIPFYDFNDFHSIWKMMKDATLSLTDTHLVMKDDEVTFRYLMSDSELMVGCEMEEEDLDIEQNAVFELSADSLKKIIMFANRISLDTVSLIIDGDDVRIRAFNKDSDGTRDHSTEFKVPVGTHDGSLDGEILKLQVGALNVLPVKTDYTVVVSGEDNEVSFVAEIEEMQVRINIGCID